MSDQGKKLISAAPLVSARIIRAHFFKSLSSYCFSRTREIKVFKRESESFSKSLSSYSETCRKPVSSSASLSSELSSAVGFFSFKMSYLQ